VRTWVGTFDGVIPWSYFRADGNQGAMVSGWLRKTPRLAAIARMLDVRQLAHHWGATTTNPYPSEEDLQSLKLVGETLARHGVTSSEQGYDLSALAAAVYARGWSYSIDRAGGDFRAIIQQSGGEQGQFSAVGIGWSMEAALAFAFDKALKVVDRRESMALR